MIKYDKETVEKYRKMAITSKDDLKVGESYYSNHYNKITVLRFLTTAESYAELDLSTVGVPKPDELAWMEIQVERWSHHSPNKGTVVSLRDNNIGGESYNPWLIFKDEKTMKEYTDKLVITRGDDYDDDYDYDDYDAAAKE